MKKNKLTIAFLGAGNMASAMMRGLVDSKLAAPSSLLAYDPQLPKLKALSKRLGIVACRNADEMAARCEVLVLATKPQDLKAALQALRPSLTDQLVVSIAAGIDLATLSRLIPKACKLVRSMPNNPALIGEGITALFSRQILKPAERQAAESLFQACGDVLWVKQEEDLDAVTGLSGSGPAYVYQFVEALAQGGLRQGLSQEIAYPLALKTVLGSALTLLKTGQSPQDLIPLVTSKKGTTLAGLAVLKKGKFDSVIAQAIAAAAKRAKEIRKELKED